MSFLRDIERRVIYHYFKINNRQHKIKLLSQNIYLLKKLYFLLKYIYVKKRKKKEKKILLLFYLLKLMFDHKD